MCALLAGVSGAWADVLPNAVVGTYAFQAQALTTGASDYNISKNGENDVIISANNSGNLGAYTVSGGKNYLTCTLVVKINVPETTTAGVLCQMRKASDDNTAAQGLYLTSSLKLKTSWEGSSNRQTDASAPQLTAGEHTIIYTAGPELTGAKVYIDGTTAAITDGGLRGGDAYYKVIRIPAAYAQYITEVHLFNSVQNTTNISSIVTECSNHFHASQQSGESATVPSGKTLVIDKDDNLSKYSFGGAVNIAVASGKTLTLNKDGSSISSLTGSGTALQSTDITTTVTGSVTDITLKATAGTLTYTGTNLNGSTLDGVILGGTERITTSNTVNIKNLAGNNLNNTSYNYAFVGSGTINFYGECDLTKKADGSDCNSAKLGYGSSAYINIKEGATVTTGGIYNTTTSANNAYITVESGATFSATSDIRSTSATNNGTMSGTILYGPITLGDGSTTTMSNATPFNDNYTAGTGAVTVNGDATLNLTATTATLNKAITVAASKTLTIDGGSNTINLNVVPTFGAGSKINFKNATINYPSGIRNLANYTFTSSIAQFSETGDEYKAGGFTITNIPDGVTVKVKKYDATDYETVTPDAGTATISHEVGVSGLAAWLDYTFNESTKATNIHSPANQVITNAGNAGSGNNLTIDTGYNTDNSYNSDGTLKVMSTPWRDITWPTNYTVAVAGNVPDVENGCLVAFGSTTAGSKNYLAIIRGASQNEIKLVKGHEMNNAFEVISTMTAANATALSHLVVFTKNGNTFTVYLDGIQKTQVTYSDALGGGFQIGSIHGGVTGTGVGRVNDMATDIKNKIFAKAVRVYDYVISDDQMEALTEEFPYTSFGGKYSRTITANSNLSATDAWLNASTQGNVDVPVNAIVDAVTYYPDVEITTTAASTLTVNADMDAENIKFDGAGKLTIASDGEHNIHIYGSLTANGPISVKYGETDLSAVPVTIGESGSIDFDFSASDFSSVNAPTDYPVTGNTADYGSKVTGVYPSDIYHTYTLAFNGTTNRYVLTVGPTVALKQQQAIALVTPYYNGNHVGAGLGKYTISLGETSYAEMSDFGTAVMGWTSLGECVEPTIVFNMPTTGFYRFTSQNNLAQTGNVGKYLHNYLTDGAIALNSTEDKTTIFYVDCTNNTLLSYDNGLYLNDYNVQPAVGSSSTWTIEEGSELGKYALKWADGWYASDWNTTDKIAYGQKDANALWAIEPVDALPVTISSVGYTTLYAPVNLEIPSGVTAYTAVDGGSYLSLTAIEGGIIPANQGVILAGNAGETYNFNITEVDGTVGSNVLTGTAVAISRPANSYVLSKNSEGVVAFYKDGASTIPGFKAYLAATGGSVKAFRFADADAIEAISGVLQSEDRVIYNLAGQRINKLQKGVNIVNGKKVLVK